MNSSHFKSIMEPISFFPRGGIFLFFFRQRNKLINNLPLLEKKIGIIYNNRHILETVTQNKMRTSLDYMLIIQLNNNNNIRTLLASIISLLIKSCVTHTK